MGYRDQCKPYVCRVMLISNHVTNTSYLGKLRTAANCACGTEDSEGFSPNNHESSNYLRTPIIAFKYVLWQSLSLRFPDCSNTDDLFDDLAYVSKDKALIIE